MTSVCRKARWYAHGRWATLPRACHSPPLPSPPHPTNKTPPKWCDPLPPPRRTGRNASGSSEHRRPEQKTFWYCNALRTLLRKKKKKHETMEIWLKKKRGMNWRIKMQTQNCGRRRSYKGYDFSCCRWSWWEWFDRGAHVVTALKMPLQHLWVWYWRRKVKVLKSNKSKSSVHNMTHS